VSTSKDEATHHIGISHDMLAFVWRDVGTIVHRCRLPDAESFTSPFPWLGDSDPDKAEWRPFLGVEGAGEGLAGGSTSLTVKIRLTSPRDSGHMLHLPHL